MENTATVTADNEPLGEDEELPSLFTIQNTQTDNTDGADVFIDCPAIDIEKIATSDGTTVISDANVGDTITYVYEVTNTGNVDLTDITVFDDNATAGTGDDIELTDCETLLLEVGDSTTCELDHLVTEADWLASPITNIRRRPAPRRLVRM